MSKCTEKGKRGAKKEAMVSLIRAQSTVSRLLTPSISITELGSTPKPKGSVLSLFFLDNIFRSCNHCLASR